MEKNISSAFTYMFKGGDWKFKFLLLVLLSLPYSFFIMLQSDKTAIMKIAEQNDFNAIGLIVAISIFMTIVGIFVKGYYCKITNNVINSKDLLSDELLPSLDSGYADYLRYGFLLFVAGILAMLAFMIPFLLIIPLLVFLYIQPALFTVFCSEFKVTSLFAWKRAFAIIGQDAGKYLLVVTIIGILGITATVVKEFLPFLSKELAMVVYPVLIVYFELVIAFLYGIFATPQAIAVEEETF